MPYTSIVIAAQLLASDRVLAEQVVPPSEPGAVLVEKTSAEGATAEVSVWMPILADGRTGLLNGAQLRSVAKETERIVATGNPSFIVDEYRAGMPRLGGHDGGIAADSGTPGFDLRVSVFAASSIPPDLQIELREAVADVERYFESTLRNSALGPGGIPQDVTLRLALRVTALASNVAGASQFRAVAVRMSDLTRKLNEGTDGDPDDLQPAAPGYLDKDGLPVGISSLRVRYSSASTAVSGENRVYLTRAQFNALGFAIPTSGPASIQFDGTILMNSGFQWDYDPSDGVTLGQITRFSFQDYFARELLIQLGWISGVDFLQRDMTMMDMFRFSSAAPSLTLIGPALASIGQTPVNGWPFNPAPPNQANWISSEGGSAKASNDDLARAYSSGNQFFAPPLDYNPGLDRGLVALAGELNATAEETLGFGATPSVDPILANLVSREVVPAAAGLPPGTLSFPDFRGAQGIVLRENLFGISGLPLPAPGSVATIVTVLDECNRYDDADWPALPLVDRTRFPDGAAPRVVSWPTRPLVQWDFNKLVSAAPLQPSIVDPAVARAPSIVVVGGAAVALAPGNDAYPSSDPESGGKTVRFTGLGLGSAIEVRCDTYGADAPSVSFDIRLDQYASSTWQLSYNNDVDAYPADVYYVTDGLDDYGYVDLAGSYPEPSALETPTFVCRVRFDLPLESGTFSGGPHTAFRLSPVPPPGSFDLESVAQARGFPARAFQASAPVEVDMVTVYPNVGAQLLVDYNPSFRGHMPRLVARGARSHLNFARRLLHPDGEPAPFFDDLFDNETEMGTGNNFNNSRAAFLAQTSGAIPPWERFLMGQASTAGTTTIPRGISFWTRDPDAYQFGGPGTKAWQFRGELPDFLSYEELLILDHLGWNIVADEVDPTGPAGRNGAAVP